MIGMREKSIRSRLSAVGIVLSLVLGILVPCFEPLTAFAVSNGNWDDGVNYMEEPITETHGFNLSNNIDNVSFTVGGVTYSSDGTGAVTVEAGSSNPVDVEVNMEYKFTREQMLESGVLTNGGYVYYQMNANIKIENPIFGVGRFVTDDSWSTTEPAGYYSISKDGLITIRYTQAYLNHLKTSNDVDGTLEFKGNIVRKSGEDGDKNFEFGKVDVTVVFDDMVPTISKDCTVVPDGDSSNDLDWIIRIKNPDGVVQMENYTLTDLLDGEPAEWVDAVIEPAGAGSFGADGTVTFAHQENPPDEIVIRYTTKGAETNKPYVNVATLQKGDDTPISIQKEVIIEDAIEANKFGQADYELEPHVNDRIKWTIHVRHKAGQSLRNVVVTEDAQHPFDQAYESAAGNSYGPGYVQVTDKNGQLIDSSLYTISGNTLTFSDNSSVPSEVNIVFWAKETVPTETEENTNGNSTTESPKAQTITNTASAGREGLETIEIPGSKTYDHSINLTKSLDNINYDEGTMMWKFTLETGGQGLKESVDGYRLTDSVFSHLSQADMTKIGFNLFDTNGNGGASRYVKSDGSTTGTYGDDYNVQLLLSGDTLTVDYDDQNHPICNKIQLYYYTSIEDYLRNNLGADKLREYQDGNPVPLTNEATLTNRDGDSPMSSTGTGTGTLKKRVEATKSMTGASDDINYSLGSDDTTDKVLNWYVHLTDDSGFPTGQVVFTDQLKPNDANVQHIMTSEQRNSIVVYGSHDYYQDYFKLAPINALVDIQAIGQDGSGNSKGFTLKFTGGFDASEYHHIYIVYQSTAKTSQIEDGSVKFSNDYQIFDHDWQTTDGLTYTRESPNPPKTFRIKLNKNWNTINGSLPESTQFKVYRVLADKKGPDGGLPLDPDWGEAIGTYTMQVHGNQNQMVFKDDNQTEVLFDRWKYYPEDNTYQLYYYKIEEDPVPEGYIATGSGSSFIVRPNEQANFLKEQTITNAQLGEFKKTAVDHTNEAIVKQKQSELPIKTMEINGEMQPCYLIGWKIWLKMEKDTVYEDTMPEGMYFVTGQEDGLSEYTPVAYSTYVQVLNVASPNSGWITFTEYDQSHIKFKQDDAQYYAMTYYTAVPIKNLDSVLDGLNKVTNTVTTGGESKSATLQIVRDVQVDETSIEKSFTKGISAGHLNYSIAVNSEAKQFSNNGMIDITDNLFYAGGTKSADALSYALESIKVYPQNEDGTADKTNPLSASEYSYTVEYGAPSKDLQIANYGETAYQQVYPDAVAYRITGWQPGDRIGIRIARNPEANGTVMVRIGGSTFNYQKSWHEGKLADYFVESYQEITIPSGAAYIFILDQGTTVWRPVGDPDKKMIISDLESSILSEAKLNLSVPDATPLIVEYSYKVSGWTESDTLRFTNTASFDEDNGGGSSTSYDNVMQVSNSGGSVTTSAYPKIYKTNVNNYGVNTLSATFKVAKYDKNTNQWVYANDIETEGSGDKKRRKFIFPETALTEGNNRYPEGAADLVFSEDDETNKIHQFDLESGTLYKFVETAAPPNYRSPDWSAGKTFTDNSEFVFYYAYDGYSGTIPAEAKGKVQPIIKAGTVNIPNSNYISLSAKKIFSGETLPANAEVKLKLCWANSKRADMSEWQEVNHETLSAIPEEFDPVRTIRYSPGEDNTALSWERLPSGNSGGSVYYFVREESYTIDGVTYTYDPDSGKYKNGSEAGIYKPVYTGNGTNTDQAVIEVDNSEGIIVKKIWRDVDGNVLKKAPEDPETRKGVSVNFTVYGVKNNTRTALNLPVKALTEANNYTYKLPDRVDDTDGNSFALSYFDNYEIAETLTAHQEEVLGDRFAVSTTRKIRDGTGTLEITNTGKYTVTTGKLQVEKAWLQNESGDTESVTVELYRQAYDANGNPYNPPESEVQQQVQSSRRLPRNMFSMRRAQNALAETQTEVVEQTSTPNVMRTPSIKGIALKPLAAATDGLTAGSDIEGKFYTYTTSDYWDFINIYNVIESSSKWTKLVTSSGTQGAYWGNPDTQTYLRGGEQLTLTEGAGYKFADLSESTNAIIDESHPYLVISGNAPITVKLYYVSAGPEITIQNPNRTIVNGDSFTLTATVSDGARVTAWRSSNESVASIDNNGNITFHSDGPVEITATATDSSGNTNEATIELTAVSGEDFEPSITPAQVHEGGTATLEATKNGVTWKIEPTADNTGEATLSGATVTAKKKGTVTFVGNRGDTKKSVTLKIVSLTVQFNGEPISSGNIPMNVLSSLPVNGVLGNVTYEITGDNGVVYYDPDSKTIRAGETEGTATITLTDNAGTAGTSTVTLTITTIKSKAEPEIPENAEKVQDITITKDDGWKSAVIEDLPINDGNGHNYRYFIRETSTGSYIPVAYTGNGLELDRYSTAYLALANAVEETSSPVTLPESGSNGTKLYYVFGGILLMLAAAGYTYTKRRRWSDE